MEHYIATDRRARKEHDCNGCYRTIRIGEHYTHGAGMDGRTAWSWKYCAHCAVLIPWMSLEDSSYEHVAFDYVHGWEPKSIEELRIKVIASVFKWQHPDGSLYPVPGFRQGFDKYGNLVTKGLYYPWPKIISQQA